MSQDVVQLFSEQELDAIVATAIPYLFEGDVDRLVAIARKAVLMERVLRRRRMLENDRLQVSLALSRREIARDQYVDHGVRHGRAMDEVETQIRELLATLAAPEGGSSR